MYTYKIYNLNVASEILLPSAMPAEFEENDVIIRYADLNSQYRESENARCSMTDVNSDGESAWMSQKYTDGSYFLNIYNVGMFRIGSGSLIEYMKTVDVDVYQLEQWVLNRCVPLIMAERGSIVFHGSGLINNNNMLIICGESGSGKSTLTDALLKDNMDFAADDTIHVRVNNNVEGIGAYPLRRLCSDVVSEEEKKHLIQIPDGSKDKYVCDMKNVWPGEYATLKYIFIIVPKEVQHVDIEEYSGLDKVQKLVENLYLRTAYIRLDTMSSIMADLLTIANNVRIFAINRPIGRMTVDEQKMLIYKVLKSGK